MKSLLFGLGLGGSLGVFNGIALTLGLRFLYRQGRLMGGKHFLGWGGVVVTTALLTPLWGQTSELHVELASLWVSVWILGVSLATLILLAQLIGGQPTLLALFPRLGLWSGQAFHSGHQNDLRERVSQHLPYHLHPQVRRWLLESEHPQIWQRVLPALEPPLFEQRLQQLYQKSPEAALKTLLRASPEQLQRLSRQQMVKLLKAGPARLRARLLRRLAQYPPPARDG